MSKVFKVIPKKVKKSNGEILFPDMEIVVTTEHHCNSPFDNGAEEVKEMYMRIYGFDYRKANCTRADFDFETLG